MLWKKSNPRHWLHPNKGHYLIISKCIIHQFQSYNFSFAPCIVCMLRTIYVREVETRACCSFRREHVDRFRDSMVSEVRRARGKFHSWPKPVFCFGTTPKSTRRNNNNNRGIPSFTKLPITNRRTHLVLHLIQPNNQINHNNEPKKPIPATAATSPKGSVAIGRLRLWLGCSWQLRRLGLWRPRCQLQDRQNGSQTRRRQRKRIFVQAHADACCKDRKVNIGN